MNPTELIESLKKYLLEKGVLIKNSSELLSIQSTGDEITSLEIQSNGQKETIEVGRLVLTASSWSGYFGQNI